VADAEVISREDIVALVDAICFNTHKLVRHQMTWFRDNSSYKVRCLGVTQLAEGFGMKQACCAIVTCIMPPCHTSWKPPVLTNKSAR